MQPLYHEAKLASLSYILVPMYIYACSLAAYEIAKVVTEKAALALPPFYAFTGCDTVNTSGHLQKLSELFSLTRSSLR